jgi:hypothetical protein
MDDNGVFVRYWNSKTGDRALQNQMILEVDGDDLDAAQKILDRLKNFGIDIARPSALDQEELYLRQIANKYVIKIPTPKSVKDQTQRIANIQAALTDGLKLKTPIHKLPGYQPRGVNMVGQAGAEGGRVFTDPVLTNSKGWKKFSDDFRVHHQLFENPVEVMESIVNSGGRLIPTTDKMRRGIFPRGKSPREDLVTGGADYFFTRIMGKRSAHGQTGLVWKTDKLSRLDTISYGKDRYGRTTGIQANRKKTIDQLKSAARNGGNETNLKRGVSIYDNLDRIVTSTDGERTRMIQMFRRNGVEQWPDGRSLEDVIKTGSF